MIGPAERGPFLLLGASHYCASRRGHPVSTTAYNDCARQCDACNPGFLPQQSARFGKAFERADLVEPALHLVTLKEA